MQKHVTIINIKWIKIGKNIKHLSIHLANNHQIPTSASYHSVYQKIMQYQVPILNKTEK